MKTKEQEWKVVNALSEQVESELIDQLGNSDETAGDSVWTKEKNYSLHRHIIRYNSTNSVITEEIHSPDSLKYVFMLLILFIIYPILHLLTIDVPLFNYLNSMSASGRYTEVGIQAILILVGIWACLMTRLISVGPEFDLEVDDFAVVSDSNASQYYWLTVLLGYNFTGVILVSIFSASIWLKLCILSISVTSGLVYYRKPEWFSSPFGSGTLSMAMIPILGAVWTLFPLVFVWMFSYVFGSDAPYYANHFIRLLSIQDLQMFILAGAAFSMVVTAQLFQACEEVSDSLKATRPAWFSSTTTGYALLLGYGLISVVALVAASAALDLIYWEVTGSPLLQQTMVGTLLYSQLNVMHQGYGLLESVFVRWSYLSPRVYAVGFYLLLLAPILIFLGLWIYSVGKYLISRIRLFSVLRNGEPLVSEVVPDSVVAITSSRGGFSNAHAGSLFFGRQDFILANESLISNLNQDELDAVLAHEVYHLKNRDWVANLLASLFSVLFGGRNSLLVFYDYPRIEREADDYAAEQVGDEPLCDALKQLELEVLKARKGSNSTNDSYQHQVFPETWGYLTEGWRYLTAPYRLFFSPMLLDLAHLSPKDRRERIRKKNFADS